MKRFTLNIIIPLLISFLTEISLFSEPRTLTIEECVDLANENNFTVKTNELTLRDLKMKKNTSWNSISPAINVTGSYTEDFEEEQYRLSISGGVSLKLTAGLAGEIIRARTNYEAGLLTFSETLREIEKNVRKSFCAILYQKDYYTLEKQALETSKSQWDTNRNKFSKGQISELAVFSSRVNYEKKKPQVEQARIDYINALATFKQIIGIPPDEEIELSGTLDVPETVTSLDFESLPERTEPAPSLKKAEYDVKVAKNDLLLARTSAYSPSINASYNYGKTKTEDVDDLGTRNELQVGVTIPLDGYLPFSTGGVKARSAKYTLKKAELALEDKRTSIAVETDNYIRLINQAISELGAMRENVELAKTTYRMTQTAYNYGKTDLLDLQNANDQMLNAQVDLKKQAYNLISNILEMEYLLGIPYGSFE